MKHCVYLIQTYKGCKKLSFLHPLLFYYIGNYNIYVVISGITKLLP